MLKKCSVGSAKRLGTLDVLEVEFSVIRGFGKFIRWGVAATLAVPQ